MPAITALCVDSGVTRLTERHKIALLMGTALGERELVVYFLRRGESPGFETLLTQWVRRYVAVAYSFPCSAVPTAYSRVAVVLLVAFGLQLGVFLAEPAIGQPGASGVRAGPFGFPWYRCTSFRAKEKPPQDNSREGRSLCCSADCNDIRWRRWLSMAFTGVFQVVPQKWLCYNRVANRITKSGFEMEFYYATDSFF